MRTHALAFVVILALTLAVGACSGADSPNPAAPGPTTPKWSTVWGTDIRPSQNVSVGQGVTMLVIFNTMEEGIVREITFVVTQPDGTKVTLDRVTSTSQIVGVREAAGAGYPAMMAGKYSFAVTVKESKSGQQGPILSAGGEFVAQ